MKRGKIRVQISYIYAQAKIKQLIIRPLCFRVVLTNFILNLHLYCREDTVESTDPYQQIQSKIAFTSGKRI